MPRQQDPPLLGSPATLATPSANGKATLFPLVVHAASQAGALAEMGESRERNLLRINAGQQAMTGALADVDAWLAAHPSEIDSIAAVTAYRDGATSVREAMAEAQSGFLRLDFDRVARATEMMREGEAALNEAVALLAR